MKKLFASPTVYREILDTVGQWKIIDYQGLMEQAPINISRQILGRRVRYLTGCGLLNATVYGHNKKYFYLSDSGIKFSRFQNNVKADQETLTHDLLIGEAVREICKHKKVRFGRVCDALTKDDVHPDAIIEATNKGKSFTIAVELELHQKSKKRVMAKYSKYSASKRFDYVVFISQKKPLVSAYLACLAKMNEAARKKFVFILNENLFPGHVNFSNCFCLHLDKQLSFNEFFGERKSEQNR